MLPETNTDAQDVQPVNDVRTYYYVWELSTDELRKWLVGKGICYDDLGGVVGIPSNVDVFALGVEWGKILSTSAF